MAAELLQFLTAHGTVLILALILLGAVGLVQWRKIRVAELELAFKREALERGTVVTNPDPAAVVPGPAGKGLLEQFGGLSGCAKAGLLLTFVVTFCTAVGVIGGTIGNLSAQAARHELMLAQQQLALHNQAERAPLTLVPERPHVLLEEAGTGTCRVYLTTGHAAHDLHLTAVVRDQDNPDSELRVEIAPPLLRTMESEGKRHCTVKFQATRGAGRYTVGVTATNNYREQAETSFSVRVGSSAPATK